MEQKRTLLIVAAVGIFLLVVLGAAIILNSASSTASKMDTGNSVPTVSSTDWLLSDSNLSTISSVQDLNQDGSIKIKFKRKNLPQQKDLTFFYEAVNITPLFTCNIPISKFNINLNIPITIIFNNIKIPDDWNIN